MPAVYDQTAVDIAAGPGRRSAPRGQVLKFAGFLARSTPRRSRTTTRPTRDDEADAASCPTLNEGETLQAARAIDPSSTSPSRRRASPKRRWSRSWRRRASAARRPTPPSSRPSRTAATWRSARAASTRPSSGMMVNEPAGEAASPTIVGRRLHRADGGEARRDRGGRAGLGDAAAATSTARSRTTLEQGRRSRCATSSARRSRPSIICEKCGKPMVIKWGRNGHFLACTGYPECNNTKEFKRDADGKHRSGATDARRPTRSARPAARRW